jgi:GMP synthase-like glutamine amidotransferase
MVDRMLVLQHVPYEGPGRISEWARMRGVACTVVRTYAGEHPADPANAGLIVVMGGPMGVGDIVRYPWLGRELSYIERAVILGMPMLGVCLGAQLIASALGAPVVRNRQKEIGWFPVRLDRSALNHRLFSGMPAVQTVLHWHGDMFEIPDGAVRVAESDACPNQGFVYGMRIVGLQYHLEADRQLLDGMVENSDEHREAGRFIMNRDQLVDGLVHHEDANGSQLFSLLDALSGGDYLESETEQTKGETG